MLMRDLFRDYNKDSRPVFNKSAAVNVELDVAFSQLVELVRTSKHFGFRALIKISHQLNRPFCQMDKHIHCKADMISSLLAENDPQISNDKCFTLCWDL